MRKILSQSEQYPQEGGQHRAPDTDTWVHKRWRDRIENGELPEDIYPSVQSEIRLRGLHPDDKNLFDELNEDILAQTETARNIERNLHPEHPAPTPPPPVYPLGIIPAEHPESGWA